MPLTEDGFLYQIKQLVTGVNAAVTPGTGSAAAADGGFHVDDPLVIGDFTRSTMLGTGAFTQTFTFPVSLPKLANAQVFNIDPGFNGLITGVNFRVGDTPVTTGSKAANLVAQSNGTNVTGGTVTLTSANSGTVGAKVGGSAITGANSFTNTQPIGVSVSSVTTFVEGDGYVELTVQNTDLQTALNNLSGFSTTSETNSVALKIPAGTTNWGQILFTIPRDYDEATDRLVLRLFAAQLSIATDTNDSLQVTSYIKLIGKALGSNNGTVKGTAPFSTTTLVLSTTEQVVEFNLSGYGLKRDAVITVDLATNGNNVTAGNEIIVYGGGWSYDSCLVSYNETDNLGVDGTLSAEGNPLR